MATKIYYGRSQTSASEQVKNIQILNETIDESLELNLGDLLIVFFEDGNTASNPSIVLRNGDSSEEVGINSDTGNFIKVQSGFDDMSGIWSAFSVCEFVYVQSEDNAYYWYLNKGMAVGDSYGAVRVVDSIPTSGSTAGMVLSADAVENRFNSFGIDSFDYNSRGGQVEVGDVVITIGDTELTATVLVPEYATASSIPLNTSDLINDGEYGTEPFLTRVVDGRIRLDMPSDTTAPYGITVKDSNNLEYVVFSPTDTLGNMRLVPLNNITIGNKRIYYGLDVVINSETQEVESGEDKELYDSVKAMGWTDCLG